MKHKRLTRVERNFYAGLLSQLLTVLLGFLLPRLTLRYYGSGVNGELSAIRQLFAYLYLLEAGVGLATTQALYRPVAVGDHHAVSAILAATSHYYRRTGVVYALLVAGIGVVYPMVVEFSLPRGVVLGYTLLYGLPSVASFLVQGKYTLLLEVDGRRYFTTALGTASNLLASLGRVLVLLLTQNLLAMQLLSCLCALLPIPIQLWYVRRHYPWLDRRAAPDYAVLGQKNAVLLHQLSGVVFNNTDMVLLSLFCSFEAVSVYSIYSLFFAQVSFVLGLCLNSGSFRLGQLYQTDRARFCEVFDLYETLYLALTGFCCTVTAAFLLPVLRLYTSGIHDAAYLDALLTLLFALKTLVECGKNIYHQVVQFAGAFQPTRWHAVAEMAINLAVTLGCIRPFGLCGCLLGTLAALGFRGVLVLRYTYKNLLHRPLSRPAAKWAGMLAVLAVVLRLVGIQPHPEWALPALLGFGLIHTIWIGAAFCGLALLFEPALFRKVRALYARKEELL